MNRKAKGTNAERELLHMFWNNGMIAMRAPSSGAIKYPCPDLLVGNLTRKLAIECKVTKSTKQYLTNKEISELKEFAKIFGAEPWVAVKFSNVNWFFLSTEDLDETKGENYVITLQSAKRKGLLFEEIVNKN